MPELLDLPPELRLKIIEFVGFPQMFDLRRVCRDFRSLIDDRKPNPRLKNVSIYLSCGDITFQCWHPAYNKNLYGIKYPRSNRKQFFKDLETILISQRATVMDRFYITDLSSVTGFYKKFKKLLESRPFPLKIEWLVMTVKNQNQLHSVLSKLDPEALKEIHINGPWQGIPNFGRIVELEQWKSAKKLKIDNSVIDIPFSSLAHFSVILVKLKTVKLEELKEFKKRLLTSQDPETFCFLNYTEMIGEEQWRQSLGPNYGEDENKWFFQFKKSSKGLHIFWRNNYITFKITDVNRLQWE